MFEFINVPAHLRKWFKGYVADALSKVNTLTDQGFESYDSSCPHTNLGKSKL